MTLFAHSDFASASRTSLRWGVALALTLGAHVAAAFLSTRAFPPVAEPGPPSAIMMELPPVDVPAPVPTVAPPDPAPQPEQAQADPPTVAPDPDPPQADVAPPPPPPIASPISIPTPIAIAQPPKKPKKKPQPIERPRVRPTPQPRRAASRPQAPAAGGGGAAGAASYAALVNAAIRSRVHYPESARAASISGRARILFTIGPSGRVTSASVSSSSGSAVLDGAALGAVRGVKLPPPPGGHFSAAVPVSFSIGGE